MIQAVAKQSRGGKKPNELRWGDLSAGDFRESAEVLRALASRLDGIADDMDTNKIKSVRVDGATKFRNGVAFVKAYVGNSASAVDDAVLDRL